MHVKPGDLLTFEAYKKAMKAAAAQIKPNTPFCIFSEVQIPDASKKLHTFKPFLVVGSPANVVLPLLKELKGSKKLTSHGLCALEGGKISLTAKTGKVDHGKLKSQAAIFKALLGKEFHHT
jgi:hypothetical protein